MIQYFLCPDHDMQTITYVTVITNLDRTEVCFLLELDCGCSTGYTPQSMKEINELAERALHLQTMDKAIITPNYPEEEEPIPMVLHCPRCGVQHIDVATDDWPNPPHRSHACQTEGCGTIWRPANVATAGVPSITSKGKSDNWHPELTPPPKSAE